LQITKDAVLQAQGVRGVLLRAGATEIELLEPLQPTTPVGRFLESRGEGLHHLCFATDDIEAELTNAKAKSLPLIDEQPRPGLAGSIAFLHPKATRGVLVEYAQPPDLTEDLDDISREQPDFDHLAIAFSDLDDGVNALATNFDLSPSAPNESSHLGIRAVRLAIGPAYIGAITPRAEDTPVASFIKHRGEGLYLVSLAIGDLDRSSDSFRRLGLSVTDPIQTEQERLAFVSPRSTHGVLIELIERAAR
jgi:methylmalonyl-CoA/ethylmalonyl-CoA epimerase